MNLLFEIIYFLIKLFFSYLTNILIQIKTHKFLESKIIEILFQEKNNENNKFLISSFYYLHYIMKKIKDKNDAETAFFLVKILYQHINNCTKNSCNCKLFNQFIKTGNIHKINEEKLNDYYISELLTLLNYLFESFFVEYNFYNNYYLSILLAEHYCHLRNNPIMAFSIISTLFLKQTNKFSIFEIVVLYELNQKYIYFIIAKEKNDLEEEMKQNKSNLLKYRKRTDEFKDYFYNIKISIIIKKFISHYICNEISLLKYRNIFEDSLSFQLDENNENIISVKNKFFEEKTKIENNINYLNIKK